MTEHRKAGKILDIPVLDHVIYTNNGHYSFTDEGVWGNQ